MEQRYSQMRAMLSDAHVRAVLANLLACALLLFPDVYTRTLQGRGYLPDLTTMLLGALLFVAASTYTRTFRVLAIAFVLLNAVYLDIVRAWGPLHLSDRIEVSLAAPAYEAIEYLRAYVGMREAKILLYVLVCVAALFATRPLALPRRVSLAALSLCLGAFITASDLNSSSLYTHAYSALPLAYKDAHARYKLMETRRAALAHVAARKLHCSEGYRNILVVIGESANRTHMSLYGYPKPSTPFLLSINPFAFEAIAPSNQTRLSIPLMLTGASVAHFDAFYSLPSLVWDMRACGYETFWISNQWREGQNDSANGSIGDEADHYWSRDVHAAAVPDEVLIPRLKQTLSGSAHRKAIFVHLMGSHIVYRNRYPKDFPTGPATGIVAEYDESIRYTDFVLSQMYRLFPPEEFLFVYVSDHGDLVRGPGPGDYGHGYSPAYKAEYEVPLVAWSAKPERLQTVRAMAQGRQINTDSFEEFVRYLIGMTPSPGVSFSRKVLDVSETAIVDFDNLRD